MRGEGKRRKGAQSVALCDPYANTYYTFMIALLQELATAQ